MGNAHWNCTDCKRQLQTELALQQNEAHLRLALDAADMGTWEVNLLTEEVFESDRMRAMYGLLPGEVNSTLDDWRRRVHPDDLGRVEGEFFDAIAGRSEYDTQYRLVRPDDTIRWVAVKGKVRPDGSGKPVSAIGVAHDITDRKQAEEALRDREEQLRMALEAAQMGIWNWNLLTNEILWSKGHEQLFGLEPGTFDGTYESFDARLHPEDRDSLNQAVSRAIKARTDYHHEFRVVWPDGSVHWIEGKGKAFYNAAGQAVRMAGTVMDISRRKQAQESLQEQFEQQRLVTEISQRVRQSLNLDEILNITVEEVRQFLHTDRAIVFRFESDWSGTVLVESVGSEWTPILSTTIYDPCFGECYVEPFKQGLVTAKSDIYTAGINPCHLDLLANFQVRANLVVPILQGENLWGLLIAHHCSEPRQWQQSEIDLLRQLATQVGLAIQQSTLFEQVQTELIERQRTEEALRQSEERFRVTLKNSPITVFNQDTELRYTWVYNPPAGIDANALVGRYESKFLSFEDAQRLAAIKHRVLNSGVGTREEVSLTIGEDVRYYDLTVEPLRNPDGEIIGLTCATMDVSEAYRELRLRQQAEAQVRALNAELEQRVLERTAQLHQINQELTHEIIQRQQMEEALMESELWYRTLFESLPLLIWVANADGQSYDCNGQCQNYLGMSKDEIRGLGWAQAVHPDDVELTLIPWQESLQTSTPFEAEYRLRRADGVYRWHVVRALPMRDDQGQIVAWIGSCTDIDDLKRAEEERAKLIDILEATPDFISSSSVDGQVLYFNKAARNILGLSPEEELTSFNIPQGHPHWAYQVIQNEGIPVAMRDGSWMGETAMLSHDGREIPLSQLIVTHKGADHRVKMLSTIGRDITQQKQVEATLREAERRWRYLLENVRLVVVGLSNIGEVEFVNSFFLQLTGYTQEDVFGKNWFEMFLPLQEQQQVHKVFQEVLDREFHPHYTNAILTKSGQERMIAWNNTQLRNLQGEVIGTMSIGEDITERYAIEKMKNEFISIVSHELRTPLTAIRGALGLLATGALNNHPERMQRMIEIASTDTERLVRLVNDILDLERLESGRVTLVKECCDAAVLIERSADAMRSLAQNETITLSVSPISVLVWASADHIIQALTNLLSNAIKFSPPSSTIALTAELQDDCVLFQVKDQGRGIPPDKLETIFERFQQVDSSDSRDKGGTGLGLAICRSIITQHGGQIWVESVLGEGSTFYFTLPASSQPA